MRDPSRGHGSHALYQGPTLVGPQMAPRLTALAAEVRFSRPIGRSHLSPQLLSPQTIGKTYPGVLPNQLLQSTSVRRVCQADVVQAISLGEDHKMGDYD